MSNPEHPTITRQLVMFPMFPNIGKPQNIFKGTLSKTENYPAYVPRCRHFVNIKSKHVK